MDKNLEMIDLFSGGGMASYAAEKLVGGYETIQFCEIDSYCKKVLKKHWPTIPIHDDIRTYKPEPYSADVIFAGFPCQDLSIAGKGRGITKETRSGLFYELMRVVCVVRPKYVIMENVAAILNNGLGIVLGELSKGRFDAEWGTFRASDYVRAAHHRDRWFCIAINRDFTDPDSFRCGGGSSEGRSIQEWQLFQREQKGRKMGGQTQGCNNNTSRWRNTKHLLNPNWREYGVKPAICRDPDGPTSELLTNRANRLHLLGNGLVPQCAAIPLQRVLDLENESQT